MTSKKVAFDPGAKLRRYKKLLEDPTPALKQIGVLAVTQSRHAFRDQKLGHDAWPVRGVPNVFGILSDFDQGRKTPPKRRFEPRPALINTPGSGGLKSSIAYRITGPYEVEVGTPKPYARVHQEGGESESVKITEKIQTALGKWLGGKGAKWAPRLAKYLKPKWRGKRDKMRVPKRPFLGITKQLVKDVEEITGAVIFEVGK